MCSFIKHELLSAHIRYEVKESENEVVSGVYRVRHLTSVKTVFNLDA